MSMESPIPNRMTGEAYDTGKTEPPEPFAGRIKVGKPVRQTVLEQAMSLTLGDRNKQYGDPRPNLTQTADLWSAYLGFPIKAYQVSIMMTLAKISRIAQNPGHSDNYVDGAAYMAIAREVCDSYSEGSK